MRGRTCHHTPPSRSHRARRALCDREGSSRIGRRSREIIVPSTLTTGALCPTRTTMVLMLVNLQGAAVISRVGRHHHHGSLCVKVGASHTPSQTHLPLTSQSPRTHTAGCPQPQSDRILRVLCGRLVPGAQFMTLPDALKRACRRSSLQASRSARSALSGCRRRCGEEAHSRGGSGTGAHGRNR